MAFTSGNAPNLISLIDAIRVFAVANGWTNNYYADDGAGKRLHISKNGCFMNFRAAVNETFSAVSDLETASNAYGLWANISTGFTGAGTAWYKQAEAINRTVSAAPRYQYAGINSINGAVNYYLFAFSDAVYVVVENPAGVFHWLGFGTISKIGDWTGGAFFFAKHTFSESNAAAKSFPFFGNSYAGQGSSRGFLRVEAVDASTGWARTDASGATGNYRAERLADSVQKMRTLWHVAPNMNSSKPILLPVKILMTRAGATFSASTTPPSIFGFLENIFFMNLGGLIPASEYPDGTGAIFRIFPFHQKQDEIAAQSPNFSTGTLGFAIRAN